MFLLFKFAPQFSLWLRADFQTVTAQTQSLSLDDGSKIIIGAESALTQDFSASRRKLALLRGEAWFEVAPDQTRPFIVTAGGMTIRVTGTAFDVAMTGRAIAVALARGSVEVRRPGKTPLQKTLKPGQRLVIDRNSGVVRITKVKPALMGGWRNGRLIVHGARLADVVDTIDRYYPGTITLISQPLAERRVTGVFDLNNPQKALRSLLQPLWRLGAQIDALAHHNFRRITPPPKKITLFPGNPAPSLVFTMRVNAIATQLQSQS